jgi:HEPN domain-containing protein
MADHMGAAEASREWLTYAERDLGSAEYLLGCRPVPMEIIAFHCHHAAEKALKANLALHDIRPPKIHDLPELHQRCKAVIPAIDTLLPPCEDLNDYGVSPRYPDQLDVTETDMRQALADAKTVMAFARPLMSDKS